MRGNSIKANTRTRKWRRVDEVQLAKMSYIVPWASGRPPQIYTNGVNGFRTRRFFISMAAKTGHPTQLTYALLVLDLMYVPHLPYGPPLPLPVSFIILGREQRYYQLRNFPRKGIIRLGCTQLTHNLPPILRTRLSRVTTTTEPRVQPLAQRRPVPESSPRSRRPSIKYETTNIVNKQHVCGAAAPIVPKLRPLIDDPAHPNPLVAVCGDPPPARYRSSPPRLLPVAQAGRSPPRGLGHPDLLAQGRSSRVLRLSPAPSRGRLRREGGGDGRRKDEAGSSWSRVDACVRMHIYTNMAHVLPGPGRRLKYLVGQHES